MGVAGGFFAMPPLGLYAALATTAGVFVGFLNAYLVSRISGLKGERRRLKQRIESIDARLDSLLTHRDWRDEQISEQLERRAQEQAEENIDDFIEDYVADRWSPPPDDVELGDIISALTDYLDCERSDLTNYHIEEIRERWDDIIEELRPSSHGGPLGMVTTDIPLDSSTRASISQIETQWEIYDRTLLDRRNADLASIRTEISSLNDERERLVEQYEEANPQDLIDNVKSTGYTIVLSVGLPLFVYLLHATNLLFTIPHGAIVEPFLVFGSWCAGLGITYQHMKKEVVDIEDNLPESPVDESAEDSIQEGIDTGTEEGELEESIEETTMEENN